jgi:DNA-binding MarR family transcriptional regulator
MADNALLHLLWETILAEIRIGEDLTLRQLFVLLKVYLDDEPQTVRGLAKCLQVGTPPITRAFDRLGETGLLRRKVDPLDRRSVLAVRTPKGAAMMERLKARMAAAAAEADLRADLRKAS